MGKSSDGLLHTARGAPWRPASGESRVSEEILSCSWIDLKTGWVSFCETKNRFKHTLPLTPGTKRILLLRTESTEGECVLPVRSSRAKLRHCRDSKPILSGLHRSASLAELRTPYLRRTYSTESEEVSSSLVSKRLLNHRALSDVTGRYPKVDDERLTEELARTERAMLSSTDVVALALLPA